MTEPAYVAIAGEYARRIRSGQLAPGSQLPSYGELAGAHGVSDIVIRRAIDLLHSQGLVRSQRRRGIFVADRPNLVRISPERQLEDPEDTYRHEAGSDVTIDRETHQVSAPDEVATAYGLAPGDEVIHVVTRATANRRPVSISDTYQPLDVTDSSGATHLEETVSDRLPTTSHAEWLHTEPGDLVKAVHQRFFNADGQLIMVSDISYPRDRYDAFVFRMALDQGLRRPAGLSD